MHFVWNRAIWSFIFKIQICKTLTIDMAYVLAELQTYKEKDSTATREQKTKTHFDPRIEWCLT